MQLKCFQTSWPWPLTYDLDLQTWLGYPYREQRIEGSGCREQRTEGSGSREGRKSMEQREQILNYMFSQSRGSSRNREREGSRGIRRSTGGREQILTVFTVNTNKSWQTKGSRVCWQTNKVIYTQRDQKEQREQGATKGAEILTVFTVNSSKSWQTITNIKIWVIHAQTTILTRVRIALILVWKQSRKNHIVWWMGVDYELFFATLCTRSDLLVIHSLGYTLMI